MMKKATRELGKTIFNASVSALIVVAFAVMFLKILLPPKTIAVSSQKTSAGSSFLKTESEKNVTDTEQKIKDQNKSHTTTTVTTTAPPSSTPGNSTTSGSITAPTTSVSSSASSGIGSSTDAGGTTASTAPTTTLPVQYDDSWLDKDCWNKLSDTVIMGDSRAVGFSVYQFMPERLVLSHVGATINYIEKNINSLAAVNPEYVVMCFGMNDRGMSSWYTPEKWIERYDALLQQVHKRLPNLKIIVSSTIVPNSTGLKRNEHYKDIPQFNAALKTYCASHGFGYVDLTDIIAARPEDYQPDGIHIRPKFYSFWATAIVNTEKSMAG